MPLDRRNRFNLVFLGQEISFCVTVGVLVSEHVRIMIQAEMNCCFYRRRHEYSPYLTQ